MPPEVLKYQAAIEAIDGTMNVEIDKFDLSELTTEDMSLPPFGDLPLGALRRTDGGHPDELLIRARFDISRDEKGLKALEFISWWVRDAARGSKQIQIRSLGLPPLPEQFGTTLSFSIDFFYADPAQDMDKMLAAIGDLGESLQEAKALYPHAFGR